MTEDTDNKKQAEKPVVKSGGRKYSYTGNVYPSVKDAAGKEAGVYDLDSAGRKLRPWLWDDAEIDKWIADYPDHVVTQRFKKV